MTVQELEQQLKKFQEDFEVTKKDFQVKLETAKKDADEWKSVAQAKEAEAKKFQEEADKAKKEKENAQAEARKREVSEFFSRMKQEERITPAQEEICLKLAESLTSEAEIHSYSDKDGKKISHTQLSLFKEIVSQLPKKQRTKPVTPSGKMQPATPDNAGEGEDHFMEVHHKGQKVMAKVDDYDLHLAALEHQNEQKEKGITVTYAEALIEASRRQKAGA